MLTVVLACSANLGDLRFLCRKLPPGSWRLPAAVPMLVPSVSVEHQQFRNCLILSGQALHRVKAFKTQAGSQSLGPGCRLSVSMGVRGDSSPPHNASPMHCSSSRTSSPFPLHRKSQIVCTTVRHGPLACTLQTPSAAGMLCLFIEGDVTGQGPAGLHVFTAPGTHLLGKHLQAPRSSECLLSVRMPEMWTDDSTACGKGSLLASQ